MNRHLLLGFLAVVYFAPILPAQTAPAAPALGEATYAQQSRTTEQTDTTGAVSKSTLVTRVDLQLGENIIHSNVLSYQQPQELLTVAEKCRTSGPDECFVLYKAYENASSAQVAARANLELSVLSLQRGQVKQAIDFIDRAAQLSAEEPFIELTRGWTLFAAGKYKKARESFANMLYLTADFEYASSAKLGTALAYYFEGNKQAAAKDFQYIYTSNPYLISFASYMMGRIASEEKSSRKLAPVFLEQSLSHDAHQYPALSLLAALSEKNKTKPLASFQYYSTLYSLDPDHKAAYKKLTQYAAKLHKRPEEYLFYVRLDQPIVQELQVPASPAIRMALYADRWQKPVEVSRVSILPSGILKVEDEKLGEVLKSPSFVTRVLAFNPETKSVDIQDARGHVEFSTRRPFVLRTVKNGKTILVKDVQADDIFAADFSDKELLGSLRVIPTDKGILLINQTQVEQLIPSLLATQAQHIKEPAALRALAVVFRAALKQAASKAKDATYQITDNDRYFKFKGINLSVRAQIDAAKQSRGLELSGTDLGYYAACGTVSYEQEGNTWHKPDFSFSPANLSKYMLSNPPADLYSAPPDPTQWSAIKWVYMYDAKEMAARLNARTRFGRLRAIEPLAFSPKGRIESMRFTGSKGEYITEDEQETLYILSAGTLRSAFFDFVPMYKGKYIERVLLRGYDTGTGVGLCVAGAAGLAKEGRDYQGIIKYYFPYARILNTHTGALH